MPRPPTYVGVAEIAEDLNVVANTVLGWIRDFEGTDHRFPEPDKATTNAAGHTKRSWRKSRLPEIRRWRKNLPVKERSPQYSPVPDGHVGVAAIAEEFGVEPNTVRIWIKNFEGTGHPFPDWDQEIDHGGKITRFWRKERLPEIKDWHKSRPSGGEPGAPKGTARPDVAERRTKPIPKPYSQPYADYVAELEAGGTSAQSRKNYVSVAGHFLRWAAEAESGNVLEIEPEGFDALLDRYRDSVLTSMSPMGQRTYRTKAKRFLVWNQQRAKKAKPRKKKAVGAAG